MSTDVERFWPKVALCASGCWVWMAATDGGYGRFTFTSLDGERGQLAHRFAFEVLVGCRPTR